MHGIITRVQPGSADNPQEQLLQQREKFWQSLMTAIRATPLRNGMLIIADMNTSAPPTEGIIGTGVPAPSHRPAQQDWPLFVPLLQDMDLITRTPGAVMGPSVAPSKPP